MIAQTQTHCDALQTLHLTAVWCEGTAAAWAGVRAPTQGGRPLGKVAWRHDQPKETASTLFHLQQLDDTATNASKDAVALQPSASNSSVTFRHYCSLGWGQGIHLGGSPLRQSGLAA